MGYSDKIVCVGEFFGFELLVLKTGKERAAEYKKAKREVLTEDQKEKRRIYARTRRNELKDTQEYKQKESKKTKKYQEKHKEELKEIRKTDVYKHKKKDYQNTPRGRKSLMMSHWKYYGLICDDYSKIYDEYLLCEQCNICKKEFKTRHDKQMDHDHNTGLFRQFLCQSCNARDHWKKVIK